MQARFEKLVQDFSISLQFEKTALNEDGECVVGIDDHVVRIALQDEYIMVYTSFWKVPDHCKEEIYFRLLMGNYFYSETGGATLGVNPTTKDVQLIYRERLSEINCSLLHNIVENFMQRVDYWKNKCESIASNLAVEPQAPGKVFSPAQTFLKV